MRLCSLSAFAYVSTPPGRPRARWWGAGGQGRRVRRYPAKNTVWRIRCTYQVRYPCDGCTASPALAKTIASRNNYQKEMGRNKGGGGVCYRTKRFVLFLLIEKRKELFCRKKETKQSALSQNRARGNSMVGKRCSRVEDDFDRKRYCERHPPSRAGTLTPKSV